MADENIMSLIQNLFIEETNLVNNQTIDLNENKYTNTFQNENLVGSNFNQQQQTKLDNDLNSKKLLLTKLSNQIANNQHLINSSSQQQQQNTQNATSFYNDLTTNPLLRSLTMKDNELDLNDELLFANKIFPSLNGVGNQLKSNYDILNNNTTPTNQNQQQQQTTVRNEHQQGSSSIKDQLPISPLSECSFKSNLLTSGPNSLNKSTVSNNLFSNFGSLINNSNNVLLQQNNSSLASTTNNLLTNNNLINNSPISSNNSLLNSNTSNLSHSTSTANSFADLILGCDDAIVQNYNNYGLNVSAAVNNNSSTVANSLKDLKLNNVQNAFNFDTAQCSSPDSFICTEEERFESQIRSLSNEIHSTIQLHMNGLHMRREGLLQQLEHIKKIYFDVLRKKKAALGATNKQLFKDQSTYANLVDQQLKSKQFEKFILPSITFNKPDSAIYKAISSLGFLNTPAFGPFCTASGDGLEFAVPGVNSTFTIETRNCFNDELLVGRENINIEILALFGDNCQKNQLDNQQQQLNDSSSLNLTSPTDQQQTTKSSILLDYSSKSVIPHTFFDHNNGKYTVTYNVPLLKSIPQELVIKININALPINDSPICVPVQTQKRQNWKLVTTFGSEGNTIGPDRNLCRPWGVAVVKMPTQLLLNIEASTSNNVSSVGDNSPQQTTTNPTTPTSPSSNEQHYLIGIADRSNNRIQMLDYNSKTQQINVINVFGSGPGNLKI